MHRFISAFLTLTLVTSFAPFIAFADDGTNQRSCASTDGLSPQASVIDSGIWGTCPWELADDGTLTVHPGSIGSVSKAPWKGSHASQISYITFLEESGKKVQLYGDCSNLFDSMNSLTGINFAGIESSQVVNMSCMFENCTSLTTLDLSTFNTSQVTNMQAMFRKCTLLTEIDFSSFTTAQVTEMSNIFFDCPALVSLDLSSFDTSGLTYMGSAGMFGGNSSLISVTLGERHPWLLLPAENVNGHEDWYSTKDKTWYDYGEIKRNRAYVADTYTKYVFDDLIIKLEANSFDYTGGSIKPKVAVKAGDYLLTENKDYSASYPENPIAVGSYSIIITVTEFYDEERILTYKITPASFDLATLSPKVLAYNGQAQTPNISGIYNGTKVIQGTDFDVTAVTDNTNAGMAKATLQGKGNFQGTRTISFRIDPKSLNGSSVSIADATYDGTEKKPVPVVTLDGITLAPSDYNVSYSNNVNAGTARVIITGKGNYIGTKTATYRILDPAKPDPEPVVPDQPAPKPDPKPDSKPATQKIPMYRLYNQWTCEHFYTASSTERKHLISIGWNDENIGWYAPASPTSAPVYRLYNPYTSDHHYTMSKAERDKCVKAGWRDEGIGWYSDVNKTTPIYRQYNPWLSVGSHNYTPSYNEHKHLCKIGWRDEQIAWYGC